MRRALSAWIDIISTVIGAGITLAALALLAGPVWAMLAAGVALLVLGLAV